MGTLFSSNKDYNRVLATQPRTSIDFPKFEPPDGLHRQAPANSFSIPTPMRISKIKNQSEDTTSTVSNEYFEPTQTLKQSNPFATIEQTNSSTVINNLTRQKSKENQPQQQIIARNTSYPVQSNLSTYQQTMTGDAAAAAISRSVMNLNDQQRQTKKHLSSSFQPFHTIVERNGQQFIVEFKERTERHYVQCIDEITHQKRLFEVTDCIPFRTIRPYKYKSQYLSQNDISQNTFFPTLQSNQRSALPPISNDRSKIVAPAKLTNNRNLNNHVNVAGEHTLQYNKVNAPFTNKTPQKIQYASSTALFSPQSAPVPPLTTKTAANLIYQHPQYSQSSSLQYSSINPKNISDQYSSKLSLTQPPLFRAHTPTISDNSASSSTSNSSDSDEEIETDNNEIISQILRSNETLNGYEQINPSFINNRNHTPVSYEIYDGYSSSTPLDPFARSLNSSDHHHYRQQPTVQKYVESIINNPRFQKSSYSDYSPIPIIVKQSTQNQYSYRNGSQKNLYNA